MRNLPESYQHDVAHLKAHQADMSCQYWALAAMVIRMPEEEKTAAEAQEVWGPRCCDGETWVGIWGPQEGRLGRGWGRGETPGRRLQAGNKGGHRHGKRRGHYEWWESPGSCVHTALLCCRSQLILANEEGQSNARVNIGILPNGKLANRVVLHGNKTSLRRIGNSNLVQSTYGRVSSHRHRTAGKNADARNQGLN